MRLIVTGGAGFAESALQWKAHEQLESSLTKTIDWYLAHHDWLVPGMVLGRLGSRNADSIGAQS